MIVRTKNPENTKNAGFTLIELSVVLIIIGLLLSGAMAGVKLYLLKAQSVKMDTQMDEVRSALSEFIQDKMPLTTTTADDATDPGSDANDPVRYPCPADPALAPGDANYGKESRAGGACSVVGGIKSVGGVFIGALPTATLGIAAKYGVDVYGNKLTYAVSSSVTADRSMAGGGGAIAGDVRVTQEDTAAPLRMAHFAIISHGKNGDGAYPSGGGAQRACSAGTLENENCDNDATFFLSLNNRAMDTAASYDDKLVYTLADQSDEGWLMTTSLGASDVVTRNPGNVGVGIVSSPTARLDVGGAGGDIFHAQGLTNALTGAVTAPNAFIIKNNGLVGAGTDSPSATFTAVPTSGAGNILSAATTASGGVGLTVDNAGRVNISGPSTGLTVTNGASIANHATITGGANIAGGTVITEGATISGSTAASITGTSVGADISGPTGLNVEGTSLGLSVVSTGGNIVALAGRSGSALTIAAADNLANFGGDIRAPSYYYSRGAGGSAPSPTPSPTGMLSVSCSVTGEYLRGFSATGVPICSSPLASVGNWNCDSGEFIQGYALNSATGRIDAVCRAPTLGNEEMTAIIGCHAPENRSGGVCLNPDANVGSYPSVTYTKMDGSTGTVSARAIAFDNSFHHQTTADASGNLSSAYGSGVDVPIGVRSFCALGFVAMGALDRADGNDFGNFCRVLPIEEDRSGKRVWHIRASTNGIAKVACHAVCMD